MYSLNLGGVKRLLTQPPTLNPSLPPSKTNEEIEKEWKGGSSTIAMELLTPKIKPLEQIEYEKYVEQFKTWGGSCRREFEESFLDSTFSSSKANLPTNHQGFLMESAMDGSLLEEESHPELEYFNSWLNKSRMFEVGTRNEKDGKLFGKWLDLSRHVSVVEYRTSKIREYHSYLSMEID